MKKIKDKVKALELLQQRDSNPKITCQWIADQCGYSRKQIERLSAERKEKDTSAILLCKSQCQVLVSYKFQFLLCWWRHEERVSDFYSSRYLAILLYVYQGQMLSHPTGQWFRRQLCCLKSWITKEQCHHRIVADSWTVQFKSELLLPDAFNLVHIPPVSMFLSFIDFFCIVQRMSWLIPCNR